MEWPNNVSISSLRAVSLSKSNLLLLKRGEGASTNVVLVSPLEPLCAVICFVYQLSENQQLIRL